MDAGGASISTGGASVSAAGGSSPGSLVTLITLQSDCSSLWTTRADILWMSAPSLWTKGCPLWTAGSLWKLTRHVPGGNDQLAEISSVTGNCTSSCGFTVTEWPPSALMPSPMSTILRSSSTPV